MPSRWRIIFASVVALAAVLGLAVAGWQLSTSRTHQLFGELVTRVETADSVVAITFDDGPSPVRRAHEYFDWGALTDPTCQSGKDGRES